MSKSAETKVKGKDTTTSANRPPPRQKEQHQEGKGSKTTKLLSILGVIVLLFSVYYYYNQLELNQTDLDNMAAATSVYDFKFIDIDGVEQSMEKYRGQVLIIVNVASECGYTQANYEQLTQLYNKYGPSASKGLSILGFPCNQFKGQEPLPEAEIKTTTCSRFKVTFDMASKVKVNGGEAHPLWNYLKKEQGGTLGSFIKWNFTKFLVDKNGKVVKRYGPSTEPNEMEKDILHYLAQ